MPSLIEGKQAPTGGVPANANGFAFRCGQESEGTFSHGHLLRRSMSEITEQTISAIIAKARSDALTIDDFVGALKQPLVSDLSGWELWPLVGFVRHERRQKWVGYVVESKLKGSGSELAASGAFAHPEGMDQEGEVPDSPGWRYFFHGSGCCLKHTDGTSIDVDFAKDGSAVEIDPYFFSRFLASVPKPDWSDACLCREPPFENVWHFELGRLSTLEFIHRKWRFRLTEKGRRLVERIEPIVDEINRLAQDTAAEATVTMSWLLTLVGDVPTALSLLGGARNDLSDLLRHAAADRVKERVALLGVAARSADEAERKLALTALAALGRQYAEREVVRALEAVPPCSVHLLSMRILASWNDPSCEKILLAVLDRFAPPAGIFGSLFRRRASEKEAIERPRNGLLVATSKLLLSYHTPAGIHQSTADKLRRVLEEDRKACDAEAGFLLYLLSPALGIAKVKASLRNRVPITREEAAIFLGMIGNDEAMNALLETAAGPPDCGGHEAACVLSMLTDQRAAAAAANWNRRNDGYEDAEANEIDFNGRKVKTWKMDDVMRANMPNFVRECSERVHREYGPLFSQWSSPRIGGI